VKDLILSLGNYIKRGRKSAAGKSSSPWGLRFGAALICVAVLTLVRAALDPILGVTHPFVTFYAAVAIAAGFGGLGPGLVALLLGLLVGNYFFVSPRYALTLHANSTAVIGNLTFCAAGLVISGTVTALRRASLRAECSITALANAEQRVMRVLQSITDACYVLDPNGCLIHMNGTAKRLLVERGLNPDELLSKHIFDEAFSEARDASCVSAFRKAMSERVVLETEIFYESSKRWYSVRFYPMEEGGLSAFFHDFTDRKHAEQRVKIQHAVTSALAHADSLRQAAPEILKGICEATGSAVASLWSLDRSANVLRCAETFVCDPGCAEQFRTVTRQVTFERGIGLPGRVWASGESVWISDVTTDANFRRAAIAISEHLHGAFATPIQLGEEFFGVIAFYSCEVRQPDDSLLQMLDGISLQIAQFINRKQADAALRESERRFVDIIDLAMDAIITIDSDQRIVTFNGAAEEMFRCPAAEAIGSSLERFIPHRYRTAHHNHVLEFAQSGKKTRRASERHGMVMALRADGEEFSIEASLSTVETGGKMLFTAIVRDITERKRAEDALRESEEKFQTLANNMSQFAWMADAEGRIFWYNQRWLDYTGTTIEEMQGWGWKKVHHPDHVDRIVMRIQHSWDSGQPWEDTFQLRGRDGTYRWFLSRAVPIRDADGRVVRWFGTNTDVTELRDVQESLRNAKDALAKSNQSLEAKVQESIANLTESRAIIERQEKLASLGVFAAGIAHEVRNPLTAIKVRLFTLKSSHKPGSSEHEDLEVIRHEIDRLEHLVHEFLQFARPAEPELQTMPVESLLRDVHDLLQSDLAGKSVDLKLELMAKEPVRVDPNKMKQVLINFVQNGAESMEAGGTITLRSRLDKQVLNGRHVTVVVMDVADTGKGIPPEVQKRLFDPFFTTKEEGTGLGLPIAARIIGKHGGAIQYQTHPNRGTTFSIVLPLAPRNENQS
jgi:PAS domain S-box-containing protein